MEDQDAGVCFGQAFRTLHEAATNIKMKNMTFTHLGETQRKDRSFGDGAGRHRADKQETAPARIGNVWFEDRNGEWCEADLDWSHHGLE